MSFYLPSLLRLSFKSNIRLIYQHKTVMNYSQDTCSHLNHINGKRVSSKNPNVKERLTILNPATGNCIAVMQESDKADIELAVDSAFNAFKTWSKVSSQERGNILHKAAKKIKEQVNEIAIVEVNEIGKTLVEAREDILACADTLDYYGSLAEKFTARQSNIFSENGFTAYTIKEPLGVCCGIGAWNYPFQMAIFKSAPALTCGNSMIFKPSPLTPSSVLIYADILYECGLPVGTFNVIQGGNTVGEAIIKHNKVRKVTMTGSVLGGKNVMNACSEGPKPVVLELGGKSPLIIFDDADIDNSVQGAMLANFLNQGQVCSNGTRVYVHENIYDEFLQKIIKLTNELKIGDPIDPKTIIGPMINAQQTDKVLTFIENAKKQNGQIKCGGKRIKLGGRLSCGNFISPCIITDLPDDAEAAKEEIFGPVMTVFKFKTDEEVIRRANDTQFGLAAGIFTKNEQRIESFTNQIESGIFYVNTFNDYPCTVPFGGVKSSGFGRELGEESLNSFIQIKAVHVRSTDLKKIF